MPGGGWGVQQSFIRAPSWILCQWNLDSNHYRDSGFQSPGFQYPQAKIFRILQAKIFRISESSLPYIGCDLSRMQLPYFQT